MNLDFSKAVFYANYFKYAFLCIVAIFLILFISVLIQVHNENKEINCITYYTSLGYTANGCENLVNKFIESVNQ